MEKKTRSSARTLRRKNKKSNSISNLKINKTRLGNPLLSQIEDTLFDLNYELHHASILDKNDEAVSFAEDRIKNSIEMFAFMIIKFQKDQPITHQEAIDKMKILNQDVNKKTKIIVQKHGRNHHSGLNRSKILNKDKNTIMFIVTVKNDFSKVLIREIRRENLLGACRMEDGQITTQEEKNDVLNALTYHFNGIPFITNGRIASLEDIHYAAFFYVSGSPLVRKWVEEKEFPFGITLELDLEQHKTKILCSSIDDWFRMNNLYQFKRK
jgi:hypothetical protein